jgi:hypothetical protein
MTAPRDDRPSDLKALRYLDALNAGDLETVAALWEDASRDPELERILTELEGELFVEIRTANGNAGVERVPGFLPKQLPATRRHWAAWIGVAGALAAACVLAVLAWSGRDGKPPEPGPGTGDSAQQVTRRTQDEFVRIPTWPESRRDVDEAEVPAFHWPLPESLPITRSTLMSDDLVD